MKSYLKEIAVFKDLIQYQLKLNKHESLSNKGLNRIKPSSNDSHNKDVRFGSEKSNDASPSYNLKLVGFPKIISYIENPNQAEILMEALGTNLRKLLK